MKITEYIVDKENWGKTFLFVVNETVLPTIRADLFDRLLTYGMKVSYHSIKKIQMDDIGTTIIFARDNFISDMRGYYPDKVFLHRNACDELIKRNFSSDRIIIFNY